MSVVNVEVKEPAVVAEGVDQPVTTAKKSRKRSVRAKAIPNGDGLVSIGGNSICGYCAEVARKFLTLPDVTGAVFCTLPCGLGWVRDNVKDPESCAELNLKVVALYGQVEGNVELAPHREALIAFGGSQTWEEWIGHLKMWRELTALHGKTIDEIKADLKSAVKKQKKTTKTNVLTLEKGSYEVASGKMLAGVRKLLDSEAGEGKKIVEPQSVIAKINTFRNTHMNEEKNQFVSIVYDQANMLVVTSKADVILEDEKHLNKIVSTLVGESVYGPALVVLTKKFVIKIT